MILPFITNNAILRLYNVFGYKIVIAHDISVYRTRTNIAFETIFCKIYINTYIYYLLAVIILI